MTKQKQQQPRERKSDATFWRDGTYFQASYLSFTGEPRRALAGWKRALITAFCVLLGWFSALHQVAAGRAFLFTAATASGIFAVLGFRRWQNWEHHRTKVKPFAAAIAPVVEQPASDPRAWLDIPVDYLTREDAEVVIYVPDDFTAGVRDMDDITRAVIVKLGIEGPKVTKKLDRRDPCLIYSRSQPPPPMVTAADIMPDILKAKPSVIIHGLGKPVDGKRQVIDTDLDSETPHEGAGMTTGDGKSTLAMNQGAQMAHHGSLLMILDYKWFSHMWADGLPNVSYARTPAEIHEALCWLGYDERDDGGIIIHESELTRRKRVGLASADVHGNITANVGPRIFLIAEELNSLIKVLKRYWRSIGGKGVSPALEALDEIGATGRQLLVNVLYIGQRLSARATGSDGSADARENIGSLILKDPTEATWKMLGGGHAQPPASGHKGRYQLVTRREVREFQGALWTPQEAREFATSGIVAVPRHDMPFVTRRELVPTVVTQPASSDMEAPDLRLVTTVPTALPAGGQVKLADMVAAGLFVTIAAARRRSTRDPLFPRPAGGDRYTGHTYNVNDIYEYLAAKGKQ